MPFSTGIILGFHKVLTILLGGQRGHTVYRALTCASFEWWSKRITTDILQDVQKMCYLH